MLQNDRSSNGRKTGPAEGRAPGLAISEKIDQYIGETYPTLLSLLVVHHKALVFERYYHQGRADEAINVKSVTKSVISALVGIALKQGYLASLDQCVGDFFPQYIPANGDPRKQAITLKQLLTLRSGLSWQEDTENLQRLFASDNWVQHGLGLPLLHPPGEVFAYSTLDAHLLSAILSQATGGNLLAFAQENLFGPMGCILPRWTCDPQGHPLGGSDLYLTPREMAKFGSLYIQQGHWDTMPIIPVEYVNASVRTQVSSGISVGADPGTVISDTYGYLWWISSIGPYASFFALGYGGQTIYVIPDLDIVLVTTAHSTGPENLGAGSRAFEVARDLARRYVVAALAHQ